MEERQVTVDGTTPPAAAAVHGDRHPEPGRAGGHVPPAREPARPVPDAHLARLPGPQRRARRSSTRTGAAETLARAARRSCQRDEVHGDDRRGPRACTSPRALKALPGRPRRGQPPPPGPRARPVAAGHAAAVGGGPRPRRRPGPRLRHARRREGASPCRCWPTASSSAPTRRPDVRGRRHRRGARRGARTGGPLTCRPARAGRSPPEASCRSWSGDCSGSSSCSSSAAALLLAVISAVLVVRLRRPEISIGRWVHPVGAHRRRHRSRRPRRAQRQPVPFTEDRPRRAGGSDQHRPDDVGAAPARRPGHRRLPHPGRAARRAHARTPRDRRRDLLGLAVGVDHRSRGNRRDGRPAHGRAVDAGARSRCARPSPDGPGRSASGPASSTPARLHRRRRAALDPLAGVGPIGGAQGSCSTPPRACAAASSCSTAARRRTTLDADEDVFERAIVAAGSLVQAGDADRPHDALRHRRRHRPARPEVATQTLRVLAPLQLGDPIIDLERDPGEGLGLVIVVTSSRSAAAWRAPSTHRSDAHSRRRVHRRGRSREAVGRPQHPSRTSNTAGASSPARPR